MSIRFNCPQYDKSIKCDDSFAGKTAKCPNCAERLKIPGDFYSIVLAEVAAPAPPPAPQATATSHTPSQNSQRRPVFDMAGRFCRLLVFENKIEIQREGVGGVLLHGLKSVKSIPVSSITAIQFKQFNLITAGYIQFTIHGGCESSGGIFDAVRNTSGRSNTARNCQATAVQRQAEAAILL